MDGSWYLIFACLHLVDLAMVSQGSKFFPGNFRDHENQGLRCVLPKDYCTIQSYELGKSDVSTMNPTVLGLDS